MSLAPGMKLSEIRFEVLTRCTLNTTGNLGARAQALVDTFARAAQRELYFRCDWTRLRVRQELTLTNGVTTYDFPDNLDPGQIDSVNVIRASDNRAFPLQPGMSQIERNSGAASTSGRPRLYTYENGAITITPAPDTTLYNGLWLEGVTALPPFVDDDELCVVDSEALIQRTELRVRPRMGMQVTKQMQDDHLAYLADLRSQQSDGAGLMLGGATSFKLTPEGENRITRTRVGWDPGWNPPGNYWGP